MKLTLLRSKSNCDNLKITNCHDHHKFKLMLHVEMPLLINYLSLNIFRIVKLYFLDATFLALHLVFRRFCLKRGTDFISICLIRGRSIRNDRKQLSLSIKL